MNIGFIGLGKLGLPVALAVESKGTMSSVMTFPQK
jgi:3-hydroxyisobutyrate dehydrogenase-like beta-hydroxyacid dehydrogenase